ncbi:CPBP family intramembrane metalloprotease [Mycolicibacterium agri]|uniref:Abortive infection protein n=1 Tax=Mycolicibacterium agri TaxID=36811 RepID=A0A2A7NCK2_MYCAG|nr:type II CAAX endopeptidase family protein [Mycolicibacterium agri]PEG41171.1 CPBP family intramembrane metalloprotease [Mycolicibacterium agri]GFG55388.1 abortive infection protein [Mycolicibacterium agri]
MTESTMASSSTHPPFFQEVKDNLKRVAIPHHEPPMVVKRRRIAVAFVLIIGGVLLGYSLGLQPGDASFYWLTLALAAVWTVGALASGPLHLGHVRFFGRNQRPVISGTVVGIVVGAVFVVGGLIAREIPPLASFVTRVLEFANYQTLWLMVFSILLNAVAEELFFRGALYTALEKHHPAVISTIIYTLAIFVATRNPMLAFAALVLGSVCAFERRATGGVLAPILTHMVWGLTMVLVLPPMFGV